MDIYYPYVKVWNKCKCCRIPYECFIFFKVKGKNIDEEYRLNVQTNLNCATHSGMYNIYCEDCCQTNRRKETGYKTDIIVTIDRERCISLLFNDKKTQKVVEQLADQNAFHFKYW